MAAIMSANPRAEIARASEALAINISAAMGVQDYIKSNLGPKGSMKMLVSGAGDIKITKDGNVLMHESQIKHPTASLIARAATAQDDVTGDGTTSIVLLIGELLKQAHVYITEGLHPRLITEGFDVARTKALEILDKISIKSDGNRDVLLEVARTSLRTKVHHKIADILTPIVVDAVLAIRRKDEQIDLHMVEIMEMAHRTDADTTLVRGLVLDHGARHPDMPKRVENAFILTCNVSFEYEKTEVNSGFFYKSPEEREKMVLAERQFILDRVNKVIALKKQVCPPGSGKSFVIINQKGIDPLSLDMFAKEGIMALRRAKRRNMERLTLACGGSAVNSVDELKEDALGFAGSVYEHVLGEDKFTFVEDCKNPQSVTILIRGPNRHTIIQVKEAVHDGLRAVLNVIEDGFVVPGAGAFEFALHEELMRFVTEGNIKGKSRFGVEAYAKAFLIIPKTLAQNAGYDTQDVMVKLQEEYRESKKVVGVDCDTGNVMFPGELGIWDNYRVKKQQINTCSLIATNLLLVDEIMRAGLSSLKAGGGDS
ncbi:T-complex protein 1 subunit zeta [Hypsibius exemplaris]|uniref:T-complex protein 1 subunit zeta n=1 Tax=Hypsibius exemplaris TaxID=2072580 RepID=A0A1W0XD17_HYPEX|nr:T-complex protein 1 subunit zeta [Hypsibius exemplaris]